MMSLVLERSHGALFLEHSNEISQRGSRQWLWLHLAKPGKNVRHVLGTQKPIRNPNMFIGRVRKGSWIVDTSCNNWCMQMLQKKGIRTASSIERDHHRFLAIDCGSRF